MTGDISKRAVAAGLPEQLERVLATFDWVEDRDDRAQLLIGYADRYRPVPDEIATPPYPEERRVPACESEAFVWSRLNDDGTLSLYFAVENPQGVSAKALAAILTEGLSGLPPDEIARVDPEVVYAVFGRDLSMGKGQGLMGIVHAVRSEAKRALRHTDRDNRGGKGQISNG